MKHSITGRLVHGTLSVFLNLRIRTRLMLAFSGVFALMLALAGFATFHMSRLHAEMSHITQNNNQQVAEVNKMIYLVNQQAVALRNLALMQDAEQKKAELEAIAKSRQDYEASHARLLKLIAEFDASEAEKALLEAIERAGTTTLPLVDQAIKLAQGDDPAAAITFLMDRVRPRQQRWVVVLQTMSGLQDKTSREFVQDSNAEFTRTRAWMIGMVTTALLSGIVLAWGVTRSITQPLGEAVRVANTIADGDLTRRVESTRRDELGELLRAMDGMVTALAAVVREVRAGSESIALGTGEIASGNADLSHRTERQAASLQRTAQSMADIRLTARDNADAATQAQTVAGEASRAAAAGGEVVAQVVQTMDGIAGASKRVVDIIGVIDSLAFQTNILALNAAVEAARAGEQGRGFAVVASEVRALARRSGEASREIRSLIHASVEQVESGSRLVQGAGSTMGEIVKQVTRVNALIEAISRSATDETAGIDSIGDAVGDIDTVTQQNAALVEQSAAAAESLRQQAQRLLDAVGRFKLAAA